MNAIDLTPLYRSSIGFDRLASMLDSAFTSDTLNTSYPPYNIEALDDNRYEVSLAVAGFSRNELNIEVENGVLTVSGSKADKEQKQYLHQGIAFRDFERRFNLADHVEVTSASLINGLLTIGLKKQVPEAMKPKSIAIEQAGDTLEHQQSDEAERSQGAAA